MWRGIANLRCALPHQISPRSLHHEQILGAPVLTRVVKLPVIYVGGKLPVTYRYLTSKLPVTYRPLPAHMGHRALVLKGVGQSLGLMTVIITR